MSVTLNFDEAVLASLPLGPGERERHMQIELACRYYHSGWLSFGQAARLAALDQYAFGVELAERGVKSRRLVPTLDSASRRTSRRSARPSIRSISRRE